jgi:acyl-CoA thioesterase
VVGIDLVDLPHLAGGDVCKWQHVALAATDCSGDEKAAPRSPSLKRVSGFERERVEGLLSGDPYAKGLGIELVEVTDTEIVVAMDVGVAHTNFLGVGHGGMVFSLADCAFSLASNNAGDAAVAIDTHLVLTAASRPGHRLTARVREVSRGRTLGTYRAEVVRDDGRTVALFTGTVYINRS